MSYFSPQKFMLCKFSEKHLVSQLPRLKKKTNLTNGLDKGTEEVLL